jgi:phosphoadenosine phosphosulfate reductase
MFLALPQVTGKRLCMLITRKDLAAVNERLEAFSAGDILFWAWKTFSRRAALLSSMQKAGTALSHMANTAGLGFDVLFVDTGVLHQETLATRDALAKTHRHLSVISLHPKHTFADQTHTEGVLYLTKEGQERCCDLRKNEPLRGVRGRYDVLISALRRGEGGKRSEIRVLDLDVEMNALRLHPFANTSNEMLNEYIASEKTVVVNPLHDMGFPTIGCFPCTSPVREDESERAGRWRHLAGVEYCGINPTDRSTKTEASIELDDRYESFLR